jgi:hypothetical protein
MQFAISRHLAWIYAVGLAIGETIVSWGHWQFAPLFIIDYLVSILLLLAFYSTRNGNKVHTLLAAWAFSLGVFYMDLFVNIDPGMPANLRCSPIVAWLIVLLIVVALVGFFTALSAIRTRRAH